MEPVIMLIEMSKYISSYNFNSISFEYLYLFFLTQNLCEILTNFYILSHSTDEYDYEELIEYSKQYCIGFMSALPLVTMCILSTITRCQKVIIKFSY